MEELLRILEKNARMPIEDIAAMLDKTPTEVAAMMDEAAEKGYIRGYEKSETANGQGELVISLKYFEGTPVIREVKRVSKPGRRVYSGSRELPTVRNGLGISIVSTPRGVLSDAEARAQNVGGEVLAEVF